MSLLTDLLHWYDMEVDAKPDQVGSADIGTGGSVETSKSGLGNCVGFDGSSGSGEFASCTEPGSGSYSINLWLNLRANQAIWYPLSTGNVRGGEKGIQLFGRFNDNEFGFFIDDGSTRVEAGYNPSATFRQWRMATCVIDRGAGEVRLYVDNVERASATIPGGFGSPDGGSMAFARRPDTFAGWSDLQLDELGIWSRALTTSEIGELWNSGTGTTWDDIKGADTVSVAATPGDPTASASAYVETDVDVAATPGDPTASASAYHAVFVDVAGTPADPTASVTILPKPTVNVAATPGNPTASVEVFHPILMSVAAQPEPPTARAIASNPVGEDEALIRGQLKGNVIRVRSRSLRIKQQLGACDSLSFSVVLGPGDDNPLEVGENLHVYMDKREETLIWAGTIDRYTERDQITAGDYTRIVDYQGVCYTALAERFYVAEQYTDTAAGDIVKDLVDTYLADDNVSKTEIEDGPVIEQATFPYIRLSEALTELADLTGFYWFINEEKELVFAKRTAVEAPEQLTDSNRPYESLEIMRGRKEYHNRYIVRAGKDLTDTQTETFVGDGERRTFNVSFPMGQSPTVTVNGSSKTVGINGVDSGKDWYWNKGRTEITQSADNTKLTASDTLEVQYKGLQPIIVRTSDSSAIQDRQQVEGGSGIYEEIISAPEIEDRTEALNIADGKLARFAKLKEDLRMTTRQDGFRKGQLLTVSLEKQNLEDSYLIDAVRWRLDGQNKLVADVTAISGDSVGGWTRYFRERQRALREFVIRENEILLIQRSQTETLSMSDSSSVSITVIEEFVIGESTINDNYIA